MSSGVKVLLRDLLDRWLKPCCALVLGGFNAG